MSDAPRVLFEFAGGGAASEWRAVNDGVMGGVSEGTFEITGAQVLAFSGALSLANNGGFASVRSNPKPLGLKPGDALAVRVRGDGREYSLNLYPDKPQPAFSYRAPVPTASGEWTEVTLPLSAFVATSFGRAVPRAGAVNPGAIAAVGFMLSDKRAGPFRLEVEWIRAVRAGA